MDDDDLHGPRLASLLEKLVDSGVRGFVYEDGPGADLVREAGERWRMPVAVVPYDGLAAAVESVLAALERGAERAGDHDRDAPPA